MKFCIVKLEKNFKTDMHISTLSFMAFVFEIIQFSSCSVNKLALSRIIIGIINVSMSTIFSINLRIHMLRARTQRAHMNLSKKLC